MPSGVGPINMLHPLQGGYNNIMNNNSSIYSIPFCREQQLLDDDERVVSNDPSESDTACA